MDTWQLSARLKEFREKEAANTITVFLFVFAILAFKPNETLIKTSLLIFWGAVLFAIFELDTFKGKMKKFSTAAMNILLLVILTLGLIATLNYFS